MAHYNWVLGADDQIVVSTRYDMPEGAHISSDEEDKKVIALNI